MEDNQQCTSCGSSPARACSQCHSAAYCSLECQQTDWRTHKQLCAAYKKLAAPSFPSRSSPNHYLVICFPMKSARPQLQWLDTKEIESGYREPIVDEALAVPGQTEWLSRGLQIVRGNILRGRPKFLDSLNIR
jgi:hypothetical protein